MAPALQLLIAALIAVESSPDNPNKRGAHGEVGCLQISQAVIDDVNEHQSAIRFTIRDAEDRDCAIIICATYLERWATPQRLGHEPTMEDMARIWNGGPYGHFKPATFEYWLRVRAELRKLGVVSL